MMDFNFWTAYCRRRLDETASEDSASSGQKDSKLVRYYSNAAFLTAAGLAGVGYLAHRHAAKKQKEAREIAKRRAIVKHYYGNRGLEHYDKYLASKQGPPLHIPSPA